MKLQYLSFKDLIFDNTSTSFTPVKNLKCIMTMFCIQINICMLAAICKDQKNNFSINVYKNKL
ncbi:MAG: hypothetical protein KA251_06250, partial [Saprospiraceae bacterium]|nr:hypothetical protein [Saprospiraceae bacterium]